MTVRTKNCVRPIKHREIRRYTQQEPPSCGEIRQNIVNRNFEDLHKDLLQENELLSVYRSLDAADREAVLDLARRLSRT
jgi:hypothetical protein